MTQSNQPAQTPAEAYAQAALHSGQETATRAEELQATLSGERTTGLIAGGVLGAGLLPGQHEAGVSGAIGTDEAYNAAVAECQTQQGMTGHP